MDEDAKKTALRMIPYGLYVLTAEDKDQNVDRLGQRGHPGIVQTPARPNLNFWPPS